MSRKPCQRTQLRRTAFLEKLVRAALLSTECAQEVLLNMIDYT